MSKITAIAAAVALGLLAGCSSTPSEPPPFEDVDTYTSSYFIDLEDTSLAAEQGEQRLYNIGLITCDKIARGDSFPAVWAELAVSGDNGYGLGLDPAGELMVSAVQNLCDEHEDALSTFLDGGSNSDRALGREACKLNPNFDITCGSY